MTVDEIINHAVVQSNRARVNEIPNDLWDHCLRTLNLTYQQVWDAFPWNQAKMLNVTATAGTDGLVTLPHYIENVRAVRIGSLPAFPMNEVNVAKYDPESFETSGSACRFTWIASAAVLTQPTAATVIKIKSSTADTAKVRIWGTVGGVEDYEDLTLNGTTIVAGSKSFSHIRKISKAITTGRVSIMDNAETELGTVAPWSTAPEYPRLQLSPLPSENVTVTMHCLRRFERLVDEYDSIVPSVFATPILHLVTASLLRGIGEMKKAMIEEKLAAGALKGVATNENDQSETDFSITPACGDFGDLGDHGERASDWPWYPTK